MAPSFDIPAFLRSLGPFSGQEEAGDLSAALEDLAARAEVWRFAEGDLVRFPDEGPSGPVWVAEGCLVVLEADTPRYLGPREALEAPPGLWVRGQTQGRLVTVAEDSWREWLRAHPRLALRFGREVPPALPRGLTRSPLGLEPGETPVHLFRKAPLYPILRCSVPGAFFLAFLAFGLFLQFGLGAPVPPLALWLLPGIGMGLTAALGALFVWEWRASVLVVTDRSVLVRQVDLWSHRSEYEKLALERLREAVFVRQGLVDSLLGLVTLELEGDSPRGRLRFRGLARSSRFLTAMEALRQRRTTEAPTRRVIRRALADKAGGARTPVLETPARKGALERPRTRRLSWRVEKAGAVWFRRHPWLVARRCLPWVGWIALVLFLAFLAAASWPEGLRPIAGVAILAGLFPLARIGWEVWDWADDRLSVQGDKVVMVHRRPLWLGEVRQEGPLDRVEQIGIRKDSLAALVLDFGTLTVSLGASDPLVFDHAAHPEWVQNEIFHHRTLLAQEEERQAARRRLDEVSEILDTWDEARKAGYFAPEPKPREKDDL